MNGEIVVSLEWILKFVSPAAIVLAVVVLYISARSGSWHMSRLRLWRLIHSDNEVSDPTIQSAIHDLTSLMAFRYITGIRVRSLAFATQLIEWTKINKEDFATIATAGAYFDCEKLQLKDRLPTKSDRIHMVIAVALVTLAFYVIAVIGLDSRAYFYFKDSGKWFTATTTEIESVGMPFLRETIHIDVERCRAKVVPTGHYSEKEVGEMCELLSSSSLITRVTDTIAMQRVSSLCFMAILAGVFFYLFSLLKQAICVGSLATRLAQRAQSATKPEIAPDVTNSNEGV